MTEIVLPGASDPVLRDTGIVIALRAMAKLADGRDDPDAAIEWAVNVGYLKPDPNDRERMLLTQKGGQAVWLYWKAWAENREESRQRRHG